MKFKLILILLLFSTGLQAQTWLTGGNGLQYYYDGQGVRHLRSVLTTPQPPFNYTDSLNKYLRLTGGNMTGNIIYLLDGGGAFNPNAGPGIGFSKSTDNAKIYFESSGDLIGDSNLIFESGDNTISAGGPTEGFLFRKTTGIVGEGIDLLRLNLSQFRYKTFDIFHAGNRRTNAEDDARFVPVTRNIVTQFGLNQGSQALNADITLRVDTTSIQTKSNSFNKVEANIRFAKLATANTFNGNQIINSGGLTVPSGDVSAGGYIIPNSANVNYPFFRAVQAALPTVGGVTPFGGQISISGRPTAASTTYATNRLYYNPATVTESKNYMPANDGTLINDFSLNQILAGENLQVVTNRGSTTSNPITTSNNTLGFAMTNGSNFNINTDGVGLNLSETNIATRMIIRKSSGDVELPTVNSGIILAAPNGSRWKITVSNTGVLTTTAL